MTRINDMGVDVHYMQEHPHALGMLQYACGLGPRKAAAIIKVRGWGAAVCLWAGGEEGSGHCQGEGVGMLQYACGLGLRKAAAIVKVRGWGAAVRLWAGVAAIRGWGCCSTQTEEGGGCYLCLTACT